MENQPLGLYLLFQFICYKVNYAQRESSDQNLTKGEGHLVTVAFTSCLRSHWLALWLTIPIFHQYLDYSCILQSFDRKQFVGSICRQDNGYQSCNTTEQAGEEYLWLLIIKYVSLKLVKILVRTFPLIHFFKRGSVKFNNSMLCPSRHEKGIKSKSKVNCII